MSAIRLKIKSGEEKHDLGVSKFLGKPVLPGDWANEFPETVLFFLQINLEEIKDLDKDNLLPHTGYLYFFLDTAEGEYDMKPIVRYFDGIPDAVFDDFNSMVPDYSQYTDEYLVEFEEVDDDEVCTRLFGNPSDWNYEDEPPKLLLQFDPLDGLGIFEYIDGLLYFFFDKKNPQNFKKVTLMEEFS